MAMTDSHERSSASGVRLIALAAFVGTTGLAGCEGYRCSEGVVSDAETAAPVADVACDARDEKGAFTGGPYTPGMTATGQVLTDAEGRYRVCGDFAGCVPECPDIWVQFSKVGYQTITVKNPGDVALPPAP